MNDTRDPFHVLSLPYDAGLDDVRAAFRRLARQTHPDRGGSAQAFQEVRAAYGALVDDLDAERRRWRTAPAPTVPPSARAAAGLDPAMFPTCTVGISRTRDGTRRVTYLTDRRPSEWRPDGAPPPGGQRVAQVDATEAAPAFGVWTVPLDAHRFRCVFGP